jgi:hypothetical protein
MSEGEGERGERREERGEGEREERRDRCETECRHESALRETGKREGGGGV